MLKLVIATIALCLLGFSNLAQPVLTKYLENIAYFNPAAVAYKPCDSLKITSFYRNQWIGTKGSPQNVTAMTEYNLSKINSGIGLNVTHERLGLFKNFEFGLSYRYSLKFKNDSALSAGASMDYSVLRLKGLMIFSNDSTLQVNSADAKINSKFGVFYSSPSLLLGASVFHLFEPVFHLDFMQTTYQLNRLYNFHGSYKFQINTHNTLSPELIVFATQNAYLSMFNFKWNRFEKTVYAAGFKVLPGVNTRYTANVSFGYLAFEKFYLGAAYEYFFRNTSWKFSNAIEFMLRYDLKKRNQNCRTDL